MQPYKTKAKKLSGTSYDELERSARKLHREVSARTKRNPYVRSKYFKNDKIFITLFWKHLNQKPRRDRKRRLRFYAAALDLLRHSTFEPASKENPNGKDEFVHRFAGITADNELFYVQVKEDKRSNNKYFISVFPPK